MALIDGNLSLRESSLSYSVLGNGYWMGGCRLAFLDKENEITNYWSSAIANRDSGKSLVVGIAESANKEVPMDGYRYIVHPADPNVLYLTVEGWKSQLKRSMDGGSNWETYISAPGSLRIHLDSSGLIASIHNELVKFVGDAPQYDDLTLMVIKME